MKCKSSYWKRPSCARTIKWDRKTGNECYVLLLINFIQVLTAKINQLINRLSLVFYRQNPKSPQCRSVGASNGISYSFVCLLSYGLAKRSQHFNATSCNIVVWCCDSYWTGWPNARNIHHNMSLFMSPRPLALGCRPKISMENFEWYRASGPSAHALVQQCCVNVAKRVQHHATSKMLHEKFDRFQIWSNIIQHVATHHNISQQGGQTYATCCAQQCCKMLRWNVASVWPGLYLYNLLLQK